MWVLYTIRNGLLPGNSSFLVSNSQARNYFGLPFHAALSIRNMSWFWMFTITFSLRRTLFWLHSCPFHKQMERKSLITNICKHIGHRMHEEDHAGLLWKTWWMLQLMCYIPEFLAWTTSCSDCDRVASLCTDSPGWTFEFLHEEADFFGLGHFLSPLPLYISEGTHTSAKEGTWELTSLWRIMRML